ncbi:hypothetical protein ACHAXT_001877 [Thalassiosira profunda]
MAASATAAEEEYAPRLQKRTLKGHRGQVLCLAHSSERRAHYASTSDGDVRQRHHPSLLLSGSEDGTARLWDLRTRRTAICMALPSTEEDTEVTAVGFHPSISEERLVDAEQSDTDGNLLPIQNDCTVYASTSNKVYGFDLRYHSTTSTAPILKEPHFDLSPSFGCTDEINQISFSYPKRNDGSGMYLVSAADDSGDVHIAESLPHRYDPQSANATIQATQKHKILQHAAPETVAIVSTATFQPRTNTDAYIATGGTDCTIKLWDASRPRKPTCTVQIKPAETENTTQLCNPPYVHSLSWSPSGKLLCAGIGDGSISILRAEGRRLNEVGRLGLDEGGHGYAVAGVCFPAFGLCGQDPIANQLSAKVRKSGEAEDRLAVSAGNDGLIIFWDLGGNMVGSGPLDPAKYLERCLSPPENEAEANDAAKAMASMDLSNDDSPEDLVPSPPKVLFRINHRHKPNWMTSSRISDAALPNSLFVADTTNNVSVYTLPL